MRRAYLLIVIPAVLVGIAYVILLRHIGVQIRLGPFLGTAAAFVAATLFGLTTGALRMAFGHITPAM